MEERQGRSYFRLGRAERAAIERGRLRGGFEATMRAVCSDLAYGLFPTRIAEARRAQFGASSSIVFR